VTVAVAIYAAVVATLAVVWQIREARAASAPSVQVSISEDSDGNGLASIIAVNRSPFRIRLVSAGICSQNAPERSNDEKFIIRLSDEARRGPEGVMLPKWIEPQDRAVVWVTRYYLQAWANLSEPVIAFAQTATNEYFYSAPTRLWGPDFELGHAEIAEAQRRLSALQHEDR
jgi:hypothetical protein